MQRSLAVEVQEFLGRGYYRHGGRVRCWRNGYEPKALRTPVGVLTMAAPQVRATAEPFRSQVAAALWPRSEALKRLVQQVCQAPTYQEGKRRAQALMARFRERYPSAMGCLAEDLEACLEHLRFPEAHRKRIRTTNLLERLFGEGKRRTKVIPRFPGEAACLWLVFATLVKASESWHGVKMTPETLRELDRLRGEPPKAEQRELVAV